MINTEAEYNQMLSDNNEYQHDNQRKMTRITIEVEFEVEDSWCANSPDEEEKDWFWNYVIPSSMILLHSNEVGDTISQTESFNIKNITFNAKEK